MSSHQVLNPADHGALRIHLGAGPAFGDAVMASLTVPHEFRRLACEYPILFRHDPERQAFSAIALFGFEQSENLFLCDGRWDAPCRPLAMEVQPFLIGQRPPGHTDAAQVHVDIAHPRVATDGTGQPVFDDTGRPTPYLDRIATLLGALDEGYVASADFYAALDRYDLLEPFSMDVPTGTGGTNRLVGYHLIHEENLRQLDAGALAELHTAGHLEPIFMALASLGNLGKLVRRKQRGRHG